MEPERPIEKLLRAFAKKRREQSAAPLELHSAMRQQLQKEIARRSAKASAGGWLSSFFIGLKPKLVFAVCFAALAVTGWILLPGLNQRKSPTIASAHLSRDEAPLDKKAAPALAPPARAPSAPLAAGEKAPVFDDKEPVVSTPPATASTLPQLAGANHQLTVPPAETPKQSTVPESHVAQTEGSPGITVASAAQQTFDFKSQGATFADSFGGSTLNKDTAAQPQSSTPAQVGTTLAAATGSTLAANEETRRKLNLQKESAAARSDAAAFFDTAKTEFARTSPAASQQFNRLDTIASRRREADTPNAATPILVSFRMEQNGNTLRVVDADGSVYTGAVQVAQQEAVRAYAPKNAPSAPPGKTDAQLQTAQNFVFHVAGTNRNLNQNVVFSGNLIPLTNAPINLDRAGAMGGAGGQRALEVESLLSNSRIAGKAVIGNQREIEVNATPAP